MFAPSYFPTSYFPPAYFVGAAPVPPPVGPSLGPGGVYFAGNYFAGNYFAPSYFPGAAAPPTLPEPAGRDTTVLRAIVAALAGLGAFRDGVHRQAPDDREYAARARDLAFVEPTDWAEQDPWDPIRLVRELRYQVTILVRERDPVARDERLDHLGTLAANALTGVALGGLTLPARTAVRRGRYGPARPPERSLTLYGECAYFVDGYAGRDPRPPEDL
jgi:hypothetical protein